MSILITGSNGLLGQKIVAQLLKSGKSFLASSRGDNRNPDCPAEFYQDLDITIESEIENICRQNTFTSIINTAAMTNVDACEEDELNCRKINVDALSYLAKAAAKFKLFLTHISTDFVFDGEDGPYKEEDKRNPLSIYATSKRDSEDVLINGEFENWSILRTIIVFGEGNNLSRSNIVLWAKGALATGQELTIVNDQFRAPTWADDLAWASIQSAEQKAKGVFHISGPETFSIHELVTRIAKFCGNNTDLVKAISSSTLNQKAKRPPKTGFDISKARRVLGYKPLTFEESLSKLEG
jgi:dTDP-4-dehydrorhamnose reductase